MTKKKYPSVTRINKRNEKGNSIILIVLTLPVLMGFAGLALDWGRGVWVKTQLQKTADAAALAGASELPDEDAAKVMAYDLVAMNFDSPDKIGVSFDVNEVTVELTENVDTLFMRVFGHYNMQVDVTATAAGIRPVGGLRQYGFPIALLNPDLNNDPADDLVDSNWGRPYIIGYGEASVLVQDWANGTEEPPDVNPSLSSEESWRGALKLPTDGVLGGGGATDLRYNMVNGWIGEMRIGDHLPIETGNIADAMNDGRTDRLALDNIKWVDFDPELDSDSARVIMVPIVHLIHETRRDEYTMQDFENGAEWDLNEVVIDGFAPFFLLSEVEYGAYINVSGNPHDWVVGFYIPGVITGEWTDGDGVDYGLYTPPRLIN